MIGGSVRLMTGPDQVTITNNSLGLTSLMGGAEGVAGWPDW